MTTGAVRPGPGPAAPSEPAPPVVSAGRPPWWLVALSAVVTVVVTADLLGSGRLERLDLRVSRTVGSWNLRTGRAYPLLWACTQLGGRGTLVAVLAVLAGYLAWRRRAVLPAVRVLVALGLLTGVVYGFKYGAGRTAPAYAGSFFHRDGASYPSGHVANAVLMWGLGRWQAVEYGLAAGWQRLFRALSVGGPVVAAVSMVFLDFHWVTDAVVGAAVGVVLLGVVHGLDATGLSLWVRARAGRRSA